MKRKSLVLSLLAAAVCAVILGYVFRGNIRDAWAAWNAPKLPTAEKFHVSTGTPSSAPGDAALVEGGTATSQHYVLESSPTVVSKVDPLANSGALPGEVNLDVPFSSQAPTGDWNLPYQEACEETASIMVDAFYRGISGKIPTDQATKAINAVVDYENKTLGFYKDTTAAETAKFIKGYFGYRDVLVVPLKSATDLKRAVANGFPVIVPTAGKLLPNPNFRSGGPLYHMLVVKGYTADRFITNDAGTRLGADFTYRFDDLMNAAHDWNGGDVLKGAPVMLIILPNHAS